MAATSLLKKLKIKPGSRIAVVNPPEGYSDELGALPEGVELSGKLEGQFAFVHLFVQDQAQLEQLVPAALGSLEEDGLFWISYPKRGSKIKTDLTRDEGWEALGKAGFRAVAIVSINEAWSAVRFRKEQFSSSQEMIEAQYGGKKASLRPIYDRLTGEALSFGPDVELAPRKSYVGLTRKKVFALVKASTNTRVDLGLKLPEGERGERLLEAPGFGSGSITHKVALTAVEDVDQEVIGWLLEAYDGVG